MEQIVVAVFSAKKATDGYYFLFKCCWTLSVCIIFCRKFRTSAILFIKRGKILRCELI